MLNKLKRKFILTNMLLVGAVLAFIFGTVCIMTYRVQKSDLTFSLEAALRDGGGPSVIGPGREDGAGGKSPRIGTFSVLVDTDGTVLQTESPSGISMDSEVLAEAVSAVLDGGRTEGTLSSLELAFMQRETAKGIRIVFASTAGFRQTVRSTALTAGGACLVALLCVYFISRALANYAMRPVEEAWERQRQFIADASHDLKTPLTVMLANLDILRSHSAALPPEELRWIDSTAEEAERMKGLTLSLLELAKTEELKNTLHPVEMDFSTHTEQAVLQYEPVAYEAGVALRTEITPGLVAAGDARVYLGLVQALVDNAVKYSPRGETVTVKLSSVRGGVSLAVHNMGGADSP